MMDINVKLLQCFINLLIKKLPVEPVRLQKNKNIYNNALAAESYKPIIRKFKKKKYTHFSETIFGAQI